MTQQIDLVRVALENMTVRVRDVNVANGWFDADRSIGDGIALLHSEVSEAFEAFRHAGLADQTRGHIGVGRLGERCSKCRETVTDEGPCICPAAKPEGYGSELADVLIRLLDQADRDGVDLAWEFDRKLAFNATRGHRHGGKRV